MTILHQKLRNRERIATFSQHLVKSSLNSIEVHHSHDPGTTYCPGQLTDPWVNFASVHGLTPVTVQTSFLLPRGNFEKRITRCTTQGNPPCRGNFFPCEQERKSCPGARVVLRMLINNVWNKFSNKKFKKAPEIGKCV